MKLDIIENNGPDNIRDTLKAQLLRASDVSIAVAFVTQSGLDQIIQSLRQVAATGRVRLLTGLYQKVPEPRALRSLLRIHAQTRGRFSVRLSREPQFHRKLYLLKDRAHDKDYWRDCITGFVEKRTERIIAETTNWDDENYVWFSPGGSHPYKIGDYIFLFGFHDRHVRLVEVKDIAHTKVATPDGRHFVAFKPVPRLIRRFSKKLWALLRIEGVNPKIANDRRKLGSTKAERLKSLIRQTPKR